MDEKFLARAAVRKLGTERMMLRSSVRNTTLAGTMRTAAIISLAIAFSLPLLTVARADETFMKKDEPTTTIMKKKHELALLPVPHETDKTIIKKEHE
jgi:hypothetical protein